MRLSLALLLLLGIFAVGMSEDTEMGTEDNPYPEDHDHGDDEGEDHEEGEEVPLAHEGEDDGLADAVNEGDEGDEGEENDGEEPLRNMHEDDGKDSQLTQQHLRDLHKKMDANKDGKTSLKEIMAFAEAKNAITKAKEIHSIFDEIDSTKDGHLSLEEHMAEYTAEMEETDPKQQEVLKAHEIEKFKAADTDGDDKLDKHELVAFMSPETHPEVFQIHVKHVFNLGDTNKDGKISKEEWDQSVRREHEQHMDENLDHDGEFKTLDENGDGHIDLKEMEHWESGRFHIETAMKKVFHIGDKDDDMHLTEHELAMTLDALEEHTDAHSHISDWAFHDEM